MLDMSKDRFLIEENVKNDIEQIEFYSNDEYELVQKVFNCLKNIKLGYSSPNSNYFTSFGETIYNQRDKIKSKRDEYNKVLTRNIEIYELGKQEAIATFSESGDVDD